MKNRITTCFLCFFVAVFTLTFSISLPFFIRPFYYLQIEPLNIPAEAGESKETIKDAYDDVLDYIINPFGEFKTGVFPHSESAKAHFADFKALFMINEALLLLSGGYIAAVLILKRKGRISFCHPLKLHPFALSGILVLTIIISIAALVFINFNRAFWIFHRIFFFGKENWLFDTETDPIIYALPQAFFMNCVIFIVISIFIISLLFILLGNFCAYRGQSNEKNRS